MPGLECIACGVAECDLPDGVDPSTVFRKVDGHTYCEGCADLRHCRECGCTDLSACPDGCWWVDTDLCSACDLVDDEEADPYV